MKVGDIRIIARQLSPHIKGVFCMATAGDEFTILRVETDRVYVEGPNQSSGWIDLETITSVTFQKESP